jgi:hypothetical protein
MILIGNPLIFVLWVLASLLIGWMGRCRKFRFIGHFLVSMFLSPPIGLLVLFATSPHPRKPRLPRQR